MNAPEKCSFCKTRFQDPAKAVRAGGSGNGVVWVCDETCKELYYEERHKKGVEARRPPRPERAGRDPGRADSEYKGNNKGAW